MEEEEHISAGFMRLASPNPRLHKMENTHKEVRFGHGK